MLFDTHNHADFSCDAHMTLEEAIAIAKKQNIGFVLTEHWDYDYPTNPELFTFSKTEFFRVNEKYRSDKVLLGIEVGMQKHLAKKEDEVAKDYPFDMVIGSIHCMNKLDLYESNAYRGMTKDEAEENFLKESLDCVLNHDNFDTLGHIDYLTRYWPYKGENLEYAKHAISYDKLLKALIEKNKVLEINTRRLDNEEAVKALIPIYNRYKALGGQYTTLGSDAHYVEHVGRRMDIALQIAKECNLEPVYFKERKMVLMEEEKVIK